MTDTSIDQVEKTFSEMALIAKKKGVSQTLDPFLTLSFLSLPVIPELKLTDCGLFDTNIFDFTNIEE